MRGYSSKTCSQCGSSFMGFNNTRYCSELCFFNDHVTIPPNAEDCWTWRSWAPHSKHQLSTYKGETMLAHRRSYRMFNGPLSQGLVIMHHCDNPSCVNPKHLSQATQDANMKDCKDKGRFASQAGSKNKAAKLNEQQVIEIYNSPSSIDDLAAKYNVATTTINAILRGQNWSHVTGLPALSRTSRR